MSLVSLGPMAFLESCPQSVTDDADANADDADADADDADAD